MSVPSIGFLLTIGTILLCGISIYREPRRFRNAIYLLLLCASVSILLTEVFQTPLFLALILIGIPFSIIIFIGFLLGNCIVLIRREGLSASTVLPGLCAIAIIALIVLFAYVLSSSPSLWLIACTFGLCSEGAYAGITFTAYALYSALYRRIPKHADYAYVIIHGAGLSGSEPTPLLAGRIDKGAEVWQACSPDTKIIVSGGKGSDEVVSEAQAMETYLIEHYPIPREVIVKEDRSRTTMENLVYSKEIMDRLSGETPYRCAVVTSDYHVMRAAIYAHRQGIDADGIGSKTARYYVPTAFIREFVAISKAHKWPYIVIVLIWAIMLILSLLPW
ncbi:MAG: YdcF family protein [Eggerthellaceae bacterium]|jgi:uncharacterized SAM-binding protein YcdF (DUF218 family)|nr:YdcF family protein [Eggerthellaceae bacterium]MCH4221394.1 YdcF family protein [Eggerthellaceae bacterium]